MPPSAAFLDELAHGLIDATGARKKPQALADALIFTPNRRAARELAFALYKAMGGTLLVPNIRALGDIEQEDAATAFGADALDLPPELPAARRRGALARLIQFWRKQREQPALPPASALAAADELAGLLDQAAIGDHVDWGKLEDLSLSADLAEHWRISATFLDIVAKAWPNYLKEQDAVDPLTRRKIAAEATAERWAAKPPKHPVIIAGSTGSAAATRIMMKATLALPKGVVVLPGLDPDLESGWASVARAPSHPQFGLSVTLRDLCVQPHEVRDWPGSHESGNARARRRLVNEALAPAEATKGWNDRLRHLASPGSAEQLVRAGLSGLRLIEAEDENEEALVAALLLRETLEHPTATAALVTPEAAVGRRVAAILERWGVDIGPSAGVPFSRTRAGSFLLTVMHWARDPAEPVMLMAVLKHPLCGLNRDADALRHLVSRLERAALRGPQLDQTLAQLAARLDKAEPEAAALIRDLDALLSPFASVFAAEAIKGDAAADACAHLAQTLAVNSASPTGDRLWAGKSGAAAVQFVEQLSELCKEMGSIESDLWPEFADGVARGISPAPDTAEHPRIAIWGPLEARLQRRDRMILAGLNEGTWPKPAPTDAFLNRSLRKKIGLSDPDDRIGLSAHDFAQMANAPEVILLRAKRVDDKPAVASRWLWRLRTLAAGGLGATQTAEDVLRGGPEHDPLAWARALRHVAEIKPAQRPSPSPPVEKRRLTSMSPSRAADMIRDPYADFAKRILRLQRLRRVGEEIDAQARGSAVHLAIQTYEEKGGSLDALIVAKLLEAGASPDLIELEKPLWLRAARVYLAWVAERASQVADRVLETRAVFEFPSPAGMVKLTATADRLEKLVDGTLAVIDFKTGQPKSAKQVLTGLEPQLALEAAIAARSPFGHIGPAPTSELIYFQFSTSAAVMKEANGQPLVFRGEDSKMQVATWDVAEAALAGLQKMIASYADAGQPYLSRPRVFSIKTFSDYDRLARRAEWTSEEGEE